MDGLPDPTTLYFNKKWSFYVHLQCGSVTYTNSFLKVADIETIADYWNVMNTVPAASVLHSDSIWLDQKRIIAYSIFKDDITPEWEHPVNAQGYEWGCRDNLTCHEFQELWSMLSMLAVNDEASHLVGVRCINKSNRLRNLYKIEVWLENVTHEQALETKNIVTDRLGFDPFSVLLHHEQKKIQAIEYTRKKIRNRHKSTNGSSC